MMGGISAGCGGARPTNNESEGRNDYGWCMWREWGARPAMIRRAYSMMGGICGGCRGARPAMNRRAETILGGICGGCGGLDQQ